MRAFALVFAAGLLVVAASCGPTTCDPVSPVGFGVCRPADGGVIAPDAGFALTVTVNTTADCTVTVVPDGGLIELSFAAGGGSCSSGQGAARAQVQSRCTIPPLAAGTWTINTNPPTVLQVPDDGGVAPCP